MAAPAIGRRRTASCLRTVVFLFLVMFVWLQLHVANLGSSRHSTPDASAADANDSTAAILSMVPQVRKSSQPQCVNGSQCANNSGDAAPSKLLQVRPAATCKPGQSHCVDGSQYNNGSSSSRDSLAKQVLHKFLTPKPRRNATLATTAANGSAGAVGLMGTALPAHKPNVSDIRRSIERYNEMQTIHNEDIFGPVQNDTLIIVVQVHTRIIYLRHLIVSLAQARDIDTVLLIFSHDFYDEEINELVQSIDFCKVMQIFYPFSIQTHPNEFPGESPGDCPRNIKKEQAKEMMCNNALYPDLYGHYREAKFTQTKHHWWWKANRVFNQLDVTRNHTGMVLFLEEDHFVAEDFIHVMHLMERTCKTSCDKCNVLSLGTYLKTYNYYGDSKKAEVTHWVSSKHNMGMAFNRTTWNDIRHCTEFFCTYDDYNWDWSLQHISQGCMTNKLYTMVMKGPRVFHIGECGVHHKKANCESTAVISKVQHVLKFAAKHLYPTHLILTVTNANKKQKLRKGNGGWGDIRDHQLCMNITKLGR